MGGALRIQRGGFGLGGGKLRLHLAHFIRAHVPRLKPPLHIAQQVFQAAYALRRLRLPRFQCPRVQIMLRGFRC